MAKRKNEDISIFNISFLDTLSCTIGALVVMLIMILIVNIGTVIEKVAEFTTKARNLKIVTTTIPNPISEKPYDLALSAMGGVPPYKWTIIKGKLPSSLALSEEGKVEGTPKEIESCEFTVQVEDVQHTKVFQRLKIEIVPPSGKVIVQEPEWIRRLKLGPPIFRILLIFAAYGIIFVIFGLLQSLIQTPYTMLREFPNRFQELPLEEKTKIQQAPLWKGLKWGVGIVVLFWLAKKWGAEDWFLWTVLFCGITGVLYGMSHLVYYLFVTLRGNEIRGVVRRIGEGGDKRR